MLREAFYSSQMEGTYTTPREMALFEIEDEAKSDPDTREVMNYVTAMAHGLGRIKNDNLPICHRLIKGWSRISTRSKRRTSRYPCLSILL
jgi:Fic family protein